MSSFKRKMKRKQMFHVGDTSDTEIKYAGRTLKLTILANTDEDIGTFLERVRKAAKENKAMVAVEAGFVPPEEAKKVWEQMKAKAERLLAEKQRGSN